MKRATSPGVSATGGGGRYARPAGFDHKADLVRKQMLLARMRTDGVAQSVIDIFTGAGEAAILALDDRRIEAVTCLTKEQRCAAIGMRAEGSTSREAADYLVAVADEAIADAVAQHEQNFRRSQAAHVPVPPLKLGDLASAIERRRSTGTPNVGVSPITRGPPTPRGSAIAGGGGGGGAGKSPASSRPSTPRVVAYGASLSPHSAVLLPPPGSSTPRRRLYSEGPGGVSPGSAAATRRTTPRSSYYRQQSQQMRLERQQSETQHTQQRRRAEARTEYDRERSRSRSRSPGVTSDGASQRARPKLWEPRHTSPRLTPVGGLSARDRKHLRTTFGESAHRSSYLPPSVQHAAHRATRASDFGGPHRLNPSLHSAFERLDSAGTSKRAGAAANGGQTPRRGAATPPPSVRRPVHQQQPVSADSERQQQKSPEPRTSGSPRPAEPRSASPEAEGQQRQASTPRLSATRERKIIDDFHALLQRENVLPDVWAGLTAAEHERRFDEWGCPRATRHVVRQAYASAANKA